MSKPRIFVSHSHKDERFTRRLVKDLERAGADVWVDKVGIQHGNFMQRIDEALGQCEWMVLVLTPSAIASEYVRDEVFTALHRVKQGYMQGVIPVLAAPCEPGTIPPHWDALHRYDATRRYKVALGEVLRMMGLSPQLSSVDELLAESDALYVQERFAEALPLAERATRLAPDNLDAWLNLAHVYIQLDQWEEARGACERALSCQPDAPSAWNLRAIMLSVFDQYEEALAALDCGLALDPERAGTTVSWSVRGSVLNRLKRYEEALAACERALAFDPDYAAAWRDKGDALRGLKRTEEAVTVYNHALALDPTDVGAKRNRGNALRALARKAQAQEVEVRALELGE